jgi:hypothetical protein
MMFNWNDCWDIQIFSRQVPLFTFCCHILIWNHSSISSLYALFSSSWFLLSPILSSSNICWQSFDLPYLWMLNHPFQTFAQLRIINFIQSVCFRKFVVTLYLNELWLILSRIGINTKTRLSQDSKSWRYFSVLDVENDKSFAVNFKINNERWADQGTYCRGWSTLSCFFPHIRRENILSSCTLHKCQSFHQFQFEMKSITIL